MGLFDSIKIDATPAAANLEVPDDGIAGWARRELGGYPGREAAVSNSEFKKRLTAEEVSSGPPGIVFPWFPPYITNYDQGADSAEMQKAYRQMLSDPNVKASLCTQLFGVASLDLQISPPAKPTRRDEEIADFCRYVFSDGQTDGLHSLFWNVFMHGSIDGYSVSEKLLTVETAGEWTGSILLTGVKPKDVGNDIVLQTDQYHNVVGLQGLRYNAAMEFDPTRYVYYRNMPLYDSPVGMSSLRAAYRAWWCLRVTQQLRMVFLERRAIPLVWGTYTVSSQKASLDKALGLAKSQNWISVPDGVKLEVLNAAGGAEEAYQAATKDWKHDIFLAIKGASLPNIEGTINDGRGDTKVQSGETDLFKWWFSKCGENLFNSRKAGLIRDVVNLNYVTTRYPRATLSAVNADQIATELKNYSTGWSMGLDLSKEEIYEKCSWKRPTDPADTLKGKPADAGPGGGPPGGPGAPPSPPVPPVPTPGVSAAPSFQFSDGWRRYLDRNTTTRPEPRS